MSEPEEESAGDAAVARATAALGEPEALFRASPRRQRLKFLAALGLVVFGVVAGILWFSAGPGNFNHFIFHFIFWPPAIGIGLLAHMLRHRGLRVLVYPEGVVRLQHGEAKSFPWAEITAVRCKLDLQGEPQVDRDDNGAIIASRLETAAPAFQVWNVWLELTRADGEKASFTAALADFPDLVDRVQKHTFPPLWEAVQAKLAAGQPAEFGPHITVMHDEIRSGKFALPWSEVKTIGLAGRIFSVKRKGAWMAKIARDATQVHNLHVLFALAVEKGVVEVMMDEGEDE